MEPLQYLDRVRADLTLFVDAVRHAGMDAPVPSCPDWTVADLTRHQGGVFHWMQHLLETKAPDYVSPKKLAAAAADEEPLSYLESRAEKAFALYGEADPDTPVWNWLDGGPAPARFWYRRMCHETTIHRVDAELAAGRTPTPVEPEVAADGIDELLTFLPARSARSGWTLPSGSYHFHSTDVPGEWVVAFGDGSIEIRREHAKADTAVRGPAWDLELFLYSRGGADGLETFGDPAHLKAWSDSINF